MPTHSFYVSDQSNNSHHVGTGFFVDKFVDHLVIGFVPINKYMCTLRIKTNKQKISLLNVHAPTELKEDDVEECSIMNSNVLTIRYQRLTSRLSLGISTLR